MEGDRGLHQSRHSLPPGAFRGSNRVDHSELRHKLLELFHSPDYRPPVLPAVAIKLLGLVRHPQVDMRDAVEMLRQDALLAGNLLRLAQSPFYGSAQVRSLEEAMLRLGLNRVSDLFLRVSTELRVFRAAGYDEPMNRLRHHSAVVAELVQKVCRLSVGLEQYAFLCGLLHDVGTAASIIAVADLVPKPPFEQVRPVIAAVHETCSELVAKLWSLSPDVSTVLALHHRLGLDGRVHPIAAAVALADGLADEVGAGFYGEADAARTTMAARELGIDQRALTLLRADATAIAAAVA